MDKPILDASVFGGRKVIDVDTHLTEPHDLWTRRAPASLKDRVPQVKVIDGKRSWVIDGDKVIGLGASPSSTVKRDGGKWPGLDYLKQQIEDVHPSSYSAKERVELLDATGVAAQVLYPNILGFGGQKAARVDDELRLASVQIFNDAMGEFQAESGQRIFPMALLPWWDPKLAVKEMERARAMGLRGVNINSDPHTFTGSDGSKLPDLGQPFWDPMWEACEALDMSANFHIGGSEQSMDWFGDQGWPGLPNDLRMALGGAMLFMNNGRVMGNLVLSGLIDRFPKLKFVSVESGLGWVPFILEALDHEYKEVGVNVGTLQRLPSEYFATNFYTCFWFERRDLTYMIRTVGVDNVMFETDFPHPICLYPIDDMDKAMSGLTEEEKVKVLSGNAARVYNIEV
ncbi:amidohydrolase family protein [Phenylobacterium sp.]|jgi:predicted TIM-barrel fold metal-dependent hydrolase|uniref:amidohydrolase family protein n=1 Tax=Phenylobacterium sp. TaxID=1871053 RepID=UPI002F42C798